MIAKNHRMDFACSTPINAIPAMSPALIGLSTSFSATFYSVPRYDSFQIPQMLPKLPGYAITIFSHTTHCQRRQPEDRSF